MENAVALVFLTLLLDKILSLCVYLFIHIGENMLKKAILSVQKWGNSLAVRIPATIARSVHFHIGTQVELSVDKENVIVKPTGKQKLTLQERLNLFDPVKHGGEVMASEIIGKEKF